MAGEVTKREYERELAVLAKGHDRVQIDIRVEDLIPVIAAIQTAIELQQVQPIERDRCEWLVKHVRGILAVDHPRLAELIDQGGRPVKG